MPDQRGHASVIQHQDLVGMVDGGEATGRIT
jgi:hypothetical protein